MDNIKPAVLKNPEQQIEAALVPVSEQVPTPPKELTPEEMLNKTLDDCAKVLDIFIPQFERGIKKIGSNATRRLLKELVEWPLSDKKYNPKDDESHLFTIGTRILEAKHTLIMYTMFGAANKQAKEKQEIQQTVEPRQE